jgi:aspartokinase/homoserine dehydrogenase 1
MEMEQIEVQSLVPQSCKDATDPESFLAQLTKEDSLFESWHAAAASEGKVLRHIAKLEDGKAKVSIQAVSPEHPFYSISGSDNVIAFTTERYSQNPLVIRGPGAGPAVTAAGVLADILRVI